MYRITVLSLLMTVSIAITAQDYWQRAVVNYTRQQYRSGNQNWQICQNKEGWMYFANNKGLLEFDGSAWTTYPLPGNAKVRSVCAVGDTIYIGALGQFGRFTRNKKGRLTYERLSDKPENMSLLNIWNIHQIGPDTYFQGDQFIFINDKNTKSNCPSGITYSNYVYHKFYVSSSEGVFVLNGKNYYKLPGIDIHETSRIIGIFPYQQKLLIVTSDKGLFLYGHHSLEPLHTSTDHTIKGENLSCAAIDNDRLALGTVQDGVILVNLKTGKSEHISIANGLQNKTVLSVAFDCNKNLWLGLDNGIDCIPLQSPLRFLDSHQSPIGSGYCSIAYKGSLYLGTNQGLYKLTKEHIQFIKGTESQVLSLDTINGQLFCGGRDFFLMTDGDHTTFFDHRGVWGVRSVTGLKNTAVVASYWGLKLLYHQPQGWVLGEDIQGARLSSKTIYVDDETGAVWVANKEKGLFRLMLSDDLKKVKSEKCYNSPQLPKGDNVCISHIDGETIIASRQGLFRYDATHDKLEQHQSLEERLEGHTTYTFIRQDPNGTIWYVTDGTLHFLRDGEKEGFLNDHLIEDFESVCLWESQAVIGTEEGYALLKTKGDYKTTTPHPAGTSPLVLPYIRKIYIGNYTDTLFYGFQKPVVINWNNNSIRLEYSATNYDPTQTVLYSYMLKGSAEKEWSPYSRRHIKEYTNLPEGDYTFHLRILTSGSQKPLETQFSFTILPPWYRSWWAYLIYSILILAAVYESYRRIQKSRQRLIQQKNEQILEKEEEIESLREEKLEIELRSQKDELVRSRMNIVRKNEMLQEIRKTAVSLNNAIPSAKDPKPEEALSTIKRRVVRLIGQIDTNIEHDEDLDAFRDSFDAVHHNFLQTLGERYPDLTRKEKMLCAYIRIGLQSKEIAPLQNISTRGIEISRYRIRQKLGLDKNASLTEFLQHL